jgi:hypothetical protein
MNDNPEFVQSAVDLIVDHPEFDKEKFLKTNPQLKEKVLQKDWFSKIILDISRNI